MGQLLLGFRSLLVKIAVFVVMAALLAWALGGTLWPRTIVVEDDPRRLDDSAWYWSLSVAGDRVRDHQRLVERAHWMMMVHKDDDTEPQPFPDSDVPAVFIRVTEPIELGFAIAFAGELADVPLWATWPSARIGQWVLFVAEDRTAFKAHPMPDRLAVEQQLARLKHGLSIQTAETIIAQRDRVLQPSEQQTE